MNHSLTIYLLATYLISSNGTDVVTLSIQMCALREPCLLHAHNTNGERPYKLLQLNLHLLA
jgi:hypothetical protein